MALALAMGMSGSPAARPAAAGETRAPRFHARSVTGESLDLERLRARGPVVIDFWATWCKPCLASLPELEALHRRYASRGLTVIAVSVDGPRNAPKVRPFARRLGLSFPIVLDEDGSLQQRFQVVAVPTTVLIATDGSIVRATPGWRPGETGMLERAIAALLPDSASATPP